MTVLIFVICILLWNREVAENGDDKYEEAANSQTVEEDTEYDTNWNQFQITPVKYVLYVKPSPEDKELSAVKDVIPIEIFRI